MKKSELTNLQLEHLNLFNLILECHGWEDLAGIERQLDQGQPTNPEGIRTYWCEQTRLEAQFHAPVFMVSLSIMDERAARSIHVFFFYENGPEHVLEWIAQVKDRLSFQTLASLLREYKEQHELPGDTLLLTDSPSKVYEMASASSR